MNTLIKYAVVDIETLGGGPNALVFQAAVVAAQVDVATRDFEITQGFYWEVAAGQPNGLFAADLNPIRTGLIDTDTLAFSFKHRTWEAIDDPVHKFRPMQKVLQAKYLIPIIRQLSWIDSRLLIAQNNEFDLGILRNKVEQESDLEMGSFYNFRKTIDIRTLQNMGLIPMVTEGKTHCAIHDALQEAELVSQAALQYYGLTSQILGGTI